MNTNMIRTGLWKWVGGSLLALAMAAVGEPANQVREIDRTTVRQPKPAVRVITEEHGTQTRTTDGERWMTTQAGTQSKTTETDWHGQWDENTWEGGAGIKNDTTLRTQVRHGNSTSRELGKASLEEKERVWEGEVGPSYKKTHKNSLGTATVRASAGASGSVLRGENGYEARGQVGIEAEVSASTRKIGVGDTDLGASLKGSGRLEASVIAKGKLGAYVDSKGITFGAEGSVGAYAKGELKLNMEAHVFGVRTNVNLVASGYAGAMAEGKAVVTLGWNGKVSFMASLGASVGLGGGVSVEFELDAEELMKKLNFTDLAQLLKWMKDFQQNPKLVLAKLGLQALRKLHESGFGVLKKLGSGAASVFEHQVLKPIQQAGGGIKDGVGKGLAFLGRLIHAPRGEAGMPAVNACLEQQAPLPSNPVGQPSMQFALCGLDGAGDGFDPSQCEGYDPYAWYPFEWPSSYNWPCL